jgi:hypothetical protein
MKNNPLERMLTKYLFLTTIVTVSANNLLAIHSSKLVSTISHSELQTGLLLFFKRDVEIAVKERT